MCKVASKRISKWADYVSKKEKINVMLANNTGKDIKIIDSIISDNTHFENNLPLLRECKELVLEDYNIFNYIAMCLDKLNPTLPKTDVVVHPAKTMSDWHNIYLNVIGRNSFKIKNTIRSLFIGKSKLYNK